MRQLTITRTKSFVGSLATMKVYIEDPAAGDLEIQGVLCRKLGTLKNGQQQSFSIDEQAAKIFVIADKLSKNYCVDYFCLSAGSEDITVSGKNHFNPFAGNPFYFDGQTDEEALKNRKKGKKTGAIILISIAVISFLLGFIFGLSGEPAPKTFRTAGLEITLTDSFREVKPEGFTMCYDSKEMAVFTMKEVFALSEGFDQYSVTEYGTMLLDANGLTGKAEIQNRDGLNFFEFSNTNSSTGVEHHYVCYFFKASDAFWSIQFAVEKENLPELRPLIETYARSITFQ